jgi:glutaredoxin
MLLYSQDNCVACEALKKKLTAQNIPFTEVKIGRDITVEEFKTLYPNVRTVPFTIISKD